MKLISHRGNINGKTEFENSPDYILKALNDGYDVEIDVWFVDNFWYLGHDSPTHKIDYYDFIYLNENLWLHCKNIESLNKLVDMSIRLNAYWLKYFWHQNDDFTLTSNGYIWTYPNKQLTTNSICVLPEDCKYSTPELIDCYGICSDYIENYKTIV